jgi:ribosomal protein S24E
MQLTIDQKMENPLLNRVEIFGSINYSGATPSNQEVAAAVAKEVPGEIIVKHIYSKFSHQEASFEAFSYKDAASKNNVEKVTKHMRKKIAEAAKKAAEEAKEASAKSEVQA